MLKANGKNIINNLMLPRVTSLESCDLNDLTQTVGILYLTTGNTYQNVPDTSGGTLIVLPSRRMPDGTVDISLQFFISNSGHPVSVRRWTKYEQWGAWKQV